MKVQKSQIIFIIIILLLSITKQLLINDLPIAANVALGVDDALMINLTDNIVNGNWLGNYGPMTLSKGVTFPILLALIYFLNIKYTTMITTLYTLACIYLVYVLSKKIKSKVLLTIIYTLILFSPIMYCYQIFQRVYRSSLIPSFAIFIIAGYINLLFMKNENSIKKKLPTIILLSIILPLFWYTREDSIWMVPYIIFMTSVLIISQIINNKKDLKTILKNTIILFIPIIMIVVYANIQSAINYKYYGVYTVHNEEYYKKALKSMKKVKSYDDVEKVSYTREKLDRISEVTVLSNIKGYLDFMLDGYSKFDGDQQDNEVQNGWFPWPLREALSAEGYYKNAQETNNFYNTLHLQIEDALEKGVLEKEDKKMGFTEIKKIFTTFVDVSKFVFSYNDVESKFLEITDFTPNSGLLYEYFAKYTGNKFMYDLSEIPNNEQSLVEQKEYRKSLVKQDEIINNLINIYKNISLVLFVIAICSYIYISVKMIYDIIKKNYELLDMWIIISGIFGAMLSLALGIAYETALNAYVITAMYLSAVYPLITIFSLVTISYLIIYIYSKVKNKEEKTC